MVCWTMHWNHAAPRDRRAERPSVDQLLLKSAAEDLNTLLAQYSASDTRQVRRSHLGVLYQSILKDRRADWPPD
jgi:hypothetical protein